MKRKTKLPKIYDNTEPTIDKRTTDEKIIDLLESAQANLHGRAKVWMNIQGMEQLKKAIIMIKNHTKK